MPVLWSEVSEDAREDLALQYEWYEGKANIPVAERYLSAFRHTVELLTRHPEAGISSAFSRSTTDRHSLRANERRIPSPSCVLPL